MLSRETLVEFLTTELAIEEAELTEHTQLFSSGMIDSFALVTLIAFIESQCGIEITPADVTLENLDTIAGVLAMAGRAGRAA